VRQEYEEAASGKKVTPWENEEILADEEKVAIEPSGF